MALAVEIDIFLEFAIRRENLKQRHRPQLAPHHSHTQGHLFPLILDFPEAHKSYIPLLSYSTFPHMQTRIQSRLTFNFN